MPIKLILTGIVSLFVLILSIFIFTGSFYSVGSGTTAIVQNTLTSQIEVVRGPKTGLKMPFFTTVETYVDVSTITFGGSTDQNTRNLEPVPVRFADYRGTIEMSFRFRLPTDDQQMIRLHNDYRRYDNAIDNLFVKNSVGTMAITANQFTGEEFFLGGQNAYKDLVEDQMKLGIYQTERRQVRVEGVGLAPVSGENTSSNSMQEESQLVWKTVPILDDSGKPRRQSNPFTAYGIEVTQITYTDSEAEVLLDELLTRRKQLIAQQIATVQEQLTLQATADTEQLRKEVERTQAVQDANRIRELAVIAEQQQVQVASQQAEKALVVANQDKDIAVVSKQRELEIAQANEGIQQANYNAAVFEAQSTVALGQAEATVLRAKYDALSASGAIYLAEMQRDVSIKLYENLANFQVKMPTNMITSGGDGGMTTNLDILSSYATIGAMDSLSARASVAAQ